jgi:16S rRNA (adenine1518-N6/adenine1519-N6)-dimethyltransferase
VAAYHAKKRLGQNFLTSDKIIQRIVDLTEAGPQSRVIEIGPGRGALTLPLAESGAELWAVEFDRDLIPYLSKLLRTFDRVRIVSGDFLEFVPDPRELPDFVLVGNLPYNITSPVIDWCVRYCDRIQKAVLMVQAELAARLAATPGSKDWSPLSIFAQTRFRVADQFLVSPKHFRPAPQVTSAVIELTPLPDRDDLPPLFFDIVRASFKQRRKLLLNNLVPNIVADASALRKALEDCAIPATMRAEQMTVTQFLKLTLHLVQHKLV